MLDRIRARWRKAFGRPPSRPPPQPAQPYVQPSPIPALPIQPMLVPEVSPEKPGTYPDIDPPVITKDFTKELEELQKGVDVKIKGKIGALYEKVDGRFEELIGSMDEAIGVRVGVLSEEMSGRMDGFQKGVDEVHGGVKEVSSNVDSLKGDLFWGGLALGAGILGVSWAPGLIRNGYRFVKFVRRRRNGPQPEVKSIQQDVPIAGYADYAEAQGQLHEAMGNRNRLYDETLGRLFDQETERLMRSDEPSIANLFHNLRFNVRMNADRQFTKNASRSSETSLAS